MRLQWYAALSVAVAGLATAQTNIASGTLEGVVTDAQSAAVRGASVIVRNRSTALTWKVATGANGQYRFLLLLPGEYDLEASRDLFQTARFESIRVTVGQPTVLDVGLQLASQRSAISVSSEPMLVETGRSQQSNTLEQRMIANLPIDRRDYLTFATLTPGVVDSTTIADNTDLRVKQASQSGLSFIGSNGRGNSVMVDGGEANDASGGVRSTLPQEAVQEFQINRSNYSAEWGGASGGAVDIVSRGGGNQFHGAMFDYWRNQALDAGNPFARVLQGAVLRRVKPPSKRNQFGASLGGPLRRDKTFAFIAYEGLVRRESSVVSILTDPSIFEPNQAQMRVINALPASVGGPLQAALTSPQSTRDLFALNSGVFPFRTDSSRFSARLDHAQSANNLFFLRFNFANIEESNANLQALVGASRGSILTQFDPTVAVGWTRIIGSRAVNELRLQGAYRNFNLNTIEQFGPEIRIAGFGIFNKDYLLPSRNVERRYEIRDNLTWIHGAHTLKLGGLALIRGAHSESEVFFPGRFTFGDLPGQLLNPGLPADFTINALQAFNLGLAQTYLQATGNPTVASTQPTIGAYVQDSWRPAANWKLDLGLRYELDVRLAPVPTAKRNFAPRFAVVWNPGGSRATVVRAGYGIYYSPNYYQIDWTATAMNDLGGRRQIAQAFTSILTPGPAAANNIFTTLRAQGVIGVPKPNRAIRPGDLAQFGVGFPFSGPVPPFSVLFGVDKGYTNPYSQQTSFSVERQLRPGMAVSAAYTYARTQKLPRSRDVNLLAAPVDPALGARSWAGFQYFRDPFLAQNNVFESTANAYYHAFIAEFQRRFARRFSLNANYTLSRTIDDVTDFNSDFQAADQANLRAERALSSYDQRHKFVGYGTWSAPAGVELSPILRANSGRPFNLLAGTDLNQDRHDSTDRPIGAARNSGSGPNFWTLDIRAGRDFSVGERVQFRVTGEAFNLLNRLNLATVNNVVGAMAGPFQVNGRHDRRPSEPLGFTSANDPRRLQLGVRVFF